MPKKLHRELSSRARKLGLPSERKDAYVYGTLNKVKKRRSARRGLLDSGRRAAV